MQNNSINVSGMTCDSCVGKVTTAVSSVPGVDDVDIDIATGEVTVIGDQVDLASVKAAVEEAGYKIAS
ncbi:hypothetical protein ADK67_21880 [Saccharothrix sp. NRRL B-16348]|uniref:heavy-metal-associated domain-containing protein n=1 Tax=Saccharothrix sp. NRRL B-16348 TaxID=1415542 RepID=UPI0006AFD70C|nr:heavy metal-associated domain-containing protein [Saccharothrix sp. NRRL B-16348]KOX23243.1 hypothetical protein ADK67_21880 [Saccharothrix sp. NRRL B-16348]